MVYKLYIDKALRKKGKKSWPVLGSPEPSSFQPQTLGLVWLECPSGQETRAGWGPDDVGCLVSCYRKL